MAAAESKRKTLVTFDSSRIKRLKAVGENGQEEFEEEPSPDEKLLSLINRIDFKKIKSEKSVELELEGEKQTEGGKFSKEAEDKRTEEAPSTWPWQDAVENLKSAQEELRVILDVIGHVEASTWLSLVRISKSKTLPFESVIKQKRLQDIGKELKRSVQKFNTQLKHDSEFYTSLMKLQKQWKIKRRKNIGILSSLDASNFLVDLSFPITTKFKPLTSSSLLSLPLSQTSSGSLFIRFPQSASLKSLCACLTSRKGKSIAVQTSTQWSDDKLGKIDHQHSDIHPEKMENAFSLEELETSRKILDKGGGDASLNVHRMLRTIHSSLFDEIVFEYIERESVSPSLSKLPLIRIEKSFFSFDIRYGNSLDVFLLPISNAAHSFSMLNPSIETNSEDKEGETKVVRMENGVMNENRERKPHYQTNKYDENSTDGALFSMELDAPANGKMNGKTKEDDNITGRVENLDRMFKKLKSFPPIQSKAMSIYLRQEYQTSLFLSQEKTGNELEKQKFRKRTADHSSKILSSKGGGKGDVTDGRVQNLEKLFWISTHFAWKRRIIRSLERIVLHCPHTLFLTHCTNQNFTSCWEVFLVLPPPISITDLSSIDSSASYPDLGDASRLLYLADFRCKVFLRDGVLSVDVGEVEEVLRKKGNQRRGKLALNLHANYESISLEELHVILLDLIASNTMDALEDEIKLLDFEVQRNHLNLNICKDNKVDVTITARRTPDQHSIEWSVNGRVYEDQNVMVVNNFLGIIHFHGLRFLLRDLLLV